MSEQESKKEAAAGEELVAVRVRTLTGMTRIRAGREWAPNKWTKTEVTAEQFEELKADKALDVEPLRAWESPDAPPLTSDEAVLEANEETKRVRQANEELVAELERSAEMHGKLAEEHEALRASHGNLVTESARAAEASAKLDAEHKALVASHAKLQSDHEALFAEYEKVHGELEALKAAAPPPAPKAG